MINNRFFSKFSLFALIMSLILPINVHAERTVRKNFALLSPEGYYVIAKKGEHQQIKSFSAFGAELSARGKGYIPVEEHFAAKCSNNQNNNSGTEMTGIYTLKPKTETRIAINFLTQDKTITTSFRLLSGTTYSFRAVCNVADQRFSASIKKVIGYLSSRSHDEVPELFQSDYELITNAEVSGDCSKGYIEIRTLG